MTAADLTCTVTQSGYVPSPTVVGVTTSVLKSSEVQDMEAFQTISVVRASGASQSGALSVSTSRSTGIAPASTPSASASQSTGLAPPGPLPTGAMMGALGSMFIMFL